MYKKVLAAVNELTNSEVATRYAIAFAKSCRASLSLVFVASPGIGPDIFRQAESALQRLFIEAQKHGIDVESITETGNPFDKINGIVKKNGIDIVFAATRRQDMRKRFFAKTFAREFALKLPCSVAMVRVVRMGKPHPGHILVPFRGRMTGVREMAFFTAKIAEGFGSSVTLFHLPPSMTSFFHGEILLKPLQREEHIPTEVEHFLEYLTKYSVPHEKRTSHGSVARAITIEASLRKNDLIIMGASERSLLGSLVGGNPVEDVLRETTCNLIVFRPAHDSANKVT